MRDYFPPTTPGYDPGSEPDSHRYDEPEPEDLCPGCGAGRDQNHDDDCSYCWPTYEALCEYWRER